MTLVHGTSFNDFEARQLSPLRSFGRSVGASVGAIVSRLASRLLAPRAVGNALRAVASPGPVIAPDAIAARRTIATPAAPMDGREQWRRATASLTAASALARSADRLHADAGRQLDSVEYALQQLIDDLSAIMPVPRPPRADVHTLRPHSAGWPAATPRHGSSLAA